MTKEIRGVNLGGWLVLEKWLTPSLFKDSSAADEYTFMRDQNLRSRIDNHRQTFITKKDFKWMRDNGINLVRIPIGYWLFKPLDGYTPTVGYLDSAMKWAEKYGLNVLIDFHAAKGSQNGFDNSGKAGSAEWFENRDSQNETVELLCKIAERYKDSPALWGIELLNEPVSKGYYFTLLRFYRQAYKRLTRILRPGTMIVFHDSFRPLLFTGAIRKRKNYPVMMDVHWYGFSFTTTNLATYLKLSAMSRKILSILLRVSQPILVGEWSTVLPQRFFDAIPMDQHMLLLKQNADMQIEAYRHTSGWIYWNYKAEGGGMWNYRSLVENGVISSDSK
jgi:glucan 1,3-beta-glucosidase